MSALSKEQLNLMSSSMKVLLDCLKGLRRLGIWTLYEKDGGIYLSDEDGVGYSVVDGECRTIENNFALGYELDIVYEPIMRVVENLSKEVNMPIKSIKFKVDDKKAVFSKGEYYPSKQEIGSFNIMLR